MKISSGSKRQSAAHEWEKNDMTTQVLENYPLVNIAIRSLLILVLTFGVAIACRRRSAAVSHRIWLLGFCGCLVIPIVTVLSPTWTLPLLPSPKSTERVTANAAIQSDTRTPSNGVNSQFPVEREPVSVPKQHSLPTRTIHQEIASIRPPMVADNNSIWLTLATWGWLVWFAGMVIVVSRQIHQLLLMRHTSRHCQAIESESWCILRDAAARQLGVGNRITLKSHPDAVSPMVIGAFRPVMLLPKGSENWSLERRQHVLLHELAHVQRQDLATQSIAGLACAIHWFNPLAWWGAHEMKRLREIACDDAVVTHTARPGHYAQTLLDVAKQYRCRQPIAAVAMARTTSVEGRIRAILDATRRRASLSKRSARIIGIAALLLATLVGSLHLSSRADEQKKLPTDKRLSAEQVDESRTMTFRALDESGRPLTKASVLVNAMGIERTGKINITTRTYATNNQGQVDVAIPRRVEEIRIWTSRSGYVPQVVYFAEGTHEEGQLIPAEYEFRLEPGSRLSGVVVDTDGNPIANAKVGVKVEVDMPTWGANPKPVISDWLANGGDAAFTGKDGRWEISNAPAPAEKSDFEFRLHVTHPDFAGDTDWGGLQKQQRITTDQLRAGTARLALERGFAISGSITGPDGKPVTKGLVIWVDQPYWANGVNETQIDASGRYETKRLAPGEYPVTIVAPGFAPDQRKIQLSRSMQDVDFQLAAGNPIRIQILDEAGNPVPNAHVAIGQWRGTEAIYNMQHSNVPESGVPRRANEDGIYTWDWAPADGVEYRIGAEGYNITPATLIAKKETHQIKLVRLMNISGSVVDAESGEPIERFQAIPVKAFRQNLGFYSTDFQTNKIAHGKDGQYTLPIESDAEPGDRYRVRIEAEGYRTAFGQKSLAVGDPPLEEDFKLEKAPALVGAVLDSSGGPVEKFTVAVGTPTTSPHFDIDSRDNKIRADDNFGIAFQVEGTNEFKLAATFEPNLIRVFNDSGFAEVLRHPDEPIGTITLEPWASVSGRLVQDGKPVPNEWILLGPLLDPGLTEARFQDGFSVKTDSDGYFRFRRLPPMSGWVKAQLSPWRDYILTSSRSVPFELEPGDHQQFSLGGEGAIITGRVVATGRTNDDLNKNWSINYLVSRSRGVDYPANAQPLSFEAAGPLQAAWLRQPDFQSWASTRENHFVKLAEDGRLRIHGVAPGEYDLVIQLYEQPAGCLVETIGEKVVPVTITEDDPAAGEVAIGDIEVACRIGPRVGSDMRSLQFTDTEGRVRYVDDMKGRYVLFHVWASWCQPCLVAMPEVKSTVEQYAGDPLSFVGLNIDQDISGAKEVVQKGGWSWAQNYLGDDSDLMRQLAVSTVPAYYLIGPDGKLVGSANDWQEMQKLLNAELR
jgi:beta-lactamase regulating signal transducer with metallopeptidase domain/uncharacterized GH25 family protein/thiol-disulfide isomerase/thioredoxin